MHSTHGFAVSRRTILLPPQNQIFSSPSEFSLAPRSEQDPRADRDYRRLGGADSGVEAVFGEEPHVILKDRLGGLVEPGLNTVNQ